MPLHLAMRSHADTEAVGARLAQSRPPRPDSISVVHLSGDLGAGKTTLARGFLRASGFNGVVRSPTYTLLETYDTAAGTVVHLDLYRLRDPSELEPLGLRDWDRAGYVWLIEWPERGGERVPPADLRISLAVARESHEFTARAATGYGRAWLQRLASA